MNQALVDERFRSERLEEQVNDLTELHQNEVENLKTAISDMEEKVGNTLTHYVRATVYDEFWLQRDFLPKETIQHHEHHT